jgi:hypothetical protein
MILVSRLEAIANGTTPDAMLIPAIELSRGVLRSRLTLSRTLTHALIKQLQTKLSLSVAVTRVRLEDWSDAAPGFQP